MKSMITYGWLSLAVMVSALSFADEPGCKDGICHVRSKHGAPESKKQKIVTPKNSVIEISDENFDKVVKNSSQPVIIDFYATWCQPCKHIKPIFEELVQEEKDWIFAAVDIDKNPAIMARCGVKVVPTFVIFKNGVQWDMIEGGTSKDQLLSKFKNSVIQDKPVDRSEINRTIQLLMAIQQRDMAAVRECIDAKIDVNNSVSTPQGAMCPLGVAIMVGSEELVDVLMQAGAAMNGTVEELIKKQIDFTVNLIEIIKTNLTYAKSRIAGLSMGDQTASDVKEEDLGQKFMMAMGNPEVDLKKLIDEGADVNTKIMAGKNQTTPLCLAMILNNKVATDMLIDAGASLDVEILSEDGRKQTVEEGIREDLEKYDQGIMKSRECLAYALNKVK